MTELACALCDVTNPESDYSLIRRACGHVLCPICHGKECAVCMGEVPSEEEPTPLEQAIEDGTLMAWAYGELYEVPDAERETRQHLVMLLTSLRLWAESLGIDTGEAWREAWQRCGAIKSARKVS